MATTSKLLIPIDADLSGLKRGIREAERAMRQSSRALTGIAEDMTKAFTVPFIGLGIGAVKAFADMQQMQTGLQTTMKAAGYSIADANTELDLLRKAALAPGLDFQQAVQGSIRLQNIGFAAEDARKILVQLANAVSMSGGTTQNLDNVTKQFGQMVAKGRIMQEDLGIIQENMPVISSLMEKAFGTKSAEKLRNMGVSAEEFVKKLTVEMEKLPRVSGGIANDITNAFSAIKLAAAQFGEALNKNLQIGERLNMFADWVTNLTGAFQNLSPTAQSAVVGVGAFLALLGPGIKLGSLMINGLIGMSASFAQLRLGMAAVQSGGFLGWWESLSKVMRANIIGITIGVVIALAGAFALLSKNVSETTWEREKLQQIEDKASESVAREKVQVGTLIGVLKSETATREQKKAALAELNRISPEYFKGLTVENAKVETLNKAYNGYVENLLRAARAKGAEEELIAMDKESNALAKQREQFEINKAKAIAFSKTQDAATAAQVYDNIEKQNKVIQEAEARLKARKDALTGVVQANVSFAVSNNEVTKSLHSTGAATESTAKKIAVYKEALADVKKEVTKSELLGVDTFDQQATAINQALDKLLTSGYTKDSPEVKNFVEMLEKINKSIAERPKRGPVSDAASISSTFVGGKMPDIPDFASMTEQFKPNQGYLDFLDQVSLKTRTLADSMGLGMSGAAGLQSGFAAMAEAVGPAFEGLANSLMGLEGAYANAGTAALAAASQIVKAALAATLANAIQDSMQKSGHPLLGIALAGIAVGAVNALFGKIGQSLQKAPKLAKGGVAYGPTMAMIGDNPNSSVDPEVVQPLSHLKKLIGSGGTNVNIGGQLRVSGSDLVWVLEKTQQKDRRVRGK